jgi:hypothetical protein
MCADGSWGVPAKSHAPKPGLWRLGWSKSKGHRAEHILKQREEVKRRTIAKRRQHNLAAAKKPKRARC